MHSDVQTTLTKTINDYREKGRIFPTGQPRSLKPPEERESKKKATPKKSINNPDESTLENVDIKDILRKKRSLPLFSQETLISLTNGFKRRLTGARARKSIFKRAKIEELDKETEETLNNENLMDVDDEIINEDDEVNSQKLVNAFIAEVRNTGPDEDLPSFSVKGKRELDEVGFL